jgi:hypothetical protein
MERPTRRRAVQEVFGGEIRPQRMALACLVCTIVALPFTGFSLWSSVLLAVSNIGVRLRLVTMKRSPGARSRRDRLFSLLLDHDGAYLVISLVSLAIDWWWLVRCSSLAKSSYEIRWILSMLWIDTFFFIFLEKNLIRLPRITQFQENIIKRLFRQTFSTDEFALFRGYYTVSSVLGITILDYICCIYFR